ncbi:MAG TPA: hypothetical protein VJ508_00970, partial [Saprospiraceae bacterium]|nr:hypothetical protein [Saprospiraceae bacterium]
ANNQVLVTGGFERLQDNTAETKPATATNTTTNINLSWFPKTNLPNMTIGYLFASNENDMSTDSLWRINDRSHRFLVQFGKSFTFWGQHTASLSVSTSTRDDQTRRNLDAKNTTVSLSNSTSFSFPLQTLVSLMISSNKFSVDSAITAQSITTNYTSLYATARYKFLENKLSIEASISPTFGDIERMLFDVRSEYSLLQNLSLLGQVSIYMNKHATNDVIWSFILRVGI